MIRLNELLRQKPQLLRELYVIRHKPSGYFLPIVSYNSRGGRGGSSVEVCSADIAQPRTFNSMRSAKSALGHWLRGEMKSNRAYDGDEDLELIPKPHRKRVEMEIVPAMLLVLEVPNEEEEEASGLSV